MMVGRFDKIATMVKATVGCSAGDSPVDRFMYPIYFWFHFVFFSALALLEFLFNGGCNQLRAYRNRSQVISNSFGWTLLDRSSSFLEELSRHRFFIAFIVTGRAVDEGPRRTLLSIFWWHMRTLSDVRVSRSITFMLFYVTFNSYLHLTDKL